MVRHGFTTPLSNFNNDRNRTSSQTSSSLHQLTETKKEVSIAETLANRDDVFTYTVKTLHKDATMTFSISDKLEDVLICG